MSKTLAFVHTAPINVTTFGDLLAEIDPSIPVTHTLDESLLADARAQGMTPQLAARIQQKMIDALDDETAVVVCTCSTIGGVAEETLLPNGEHVLRVDRAMAERAVMLGSRIIVAAALESTIGPTSRLIEEVAAQQGREVTLLPLLCVDAWPRFAAGDLAGYYATIAETLHQSELVGDVPGDVIVLAQASMAGAEALCGDMATPIVSSPRLGVEAALRAYRAATAG